MQMTRATALLGLSALAISVVLPGCFREDRKPAKPEKEVATEVSGELFEVAQERGLSSEDIRAALETFVPTGGRDEYIGLMGAGTSGRLAVFGMPSMRILKYVGVFTPEPWQGFAYDDESRDMIFASARDEIEYTFGDSGAPALSERDGAYDAVAGFMADGANGRVGIFHLDDYEAKQVVTNPIFRTSFGSVAVTSDTEFVIQNTSAPELPGGTWVKPDDPELSKRMRGGVTFWPFERGGHGANRLDPEHAFTVELPPYVQGESDAGKGRHSGVIYTLGFCRGEGIVPGQDTSCGEPGTPAVLHVINLEKAASLAPSSGSVVDGHHRVLLADAAREGALRQVELAPGPTTLAISPEGDKAVITHDFGDTISILDLGKIADADWEAAPKDEFGVPTISADGAGIESVEVGGPSADASFGSRGNAYVSVIKPGKLVRVDLKSATISAELSLDFPGGKLMIPQGDTTKPTGDYAVVMNTQTHDRFQSIGPVVSMNPHLVDISGESLRSLYDMSVPQATRIEAVALSAELVDARTVVRYASGTNPRTGKLSDFRTAAGEERVERKGNRVHVFGTLIRSHITPEIVEVDEGDVVTFHMTNLEQAQDQTHGFTISAYNVHSSWEPGKVASVSFTADKAGVYPYYCTEFCSALHLEMMGYLLVKPKDYIGGEEEAESLTPEQLEAAKRDYDKKMKEIEATQAVIDSVVEWLKENDYQNYTQAVELVDDATSQLQAGAKLQPRIDEAVAAGDWQQAKLWAEQYYQYQVKAADAGVRAKKIISEEGQK